MGLLKKFFACLGFEDKEELQAQFDALYHAHEEEESVEEPEPEIVVDIDPVVADYERLIRMSSDPDEKKDLEARLKVYKEKYKRRGGL